MTSSLPAAGGPSATPPTPPLAHIARGLAPTAILPVAAGLAPLIALFAGKGLAPLMLVAALLPALADLAQGRRPALVNGGLLTVGGLLVGWSGLSLVWSIDRHETLDLLYRLALILLATSILLAQVARFTEAERNRVLTWLLAGLVIATGFVWLEATTDAVLSRALNSRSSGLPSLKPGGTVLVMLIWPALLPLIARRRRWPLIPLLALLLFVPLARVDARAAFLAMGCGGTLFLGGLIRPRLTAALFGAVVLATGLAAPWVAPPLAARLAPPVASLDQSPLPASGRHRLLIWNFAAERIQERPLLGWGLNAARVMPGSDRIVDPLTGGTAMPLHPHSAVLQFWLELGLPGALLGLGIMLVALRGGAMLAAGPAARGAALASFGAAWVVSMMSYGIWQNWWLCALALAAAFCRAAPEGGRDRT